MSFPVLSVYVSFVFCAACRLLCAVGGCIAGLAHAAPCGVARGGVAPAVVRHAMAACVAAVLWVSGRWTLYTDRVADTR